MRVKLARGLSLASRGPNWSFLNKIRMKKPGETRALPVGAPNWSVLNKNLIERPRQSEIGKPEPELAIP